MACKPGQGGGKRAGAGRKPNLVNATLDGRSSADREAAARLIEALNQPAEKNESYEVAGWRLLWEAQDLRVRLDTRKYLYDKRDGKAMQRTEVTGKDSGPVKAEMIFMVQDIGKPSTRAVFRGSERIDGPPRRKL
jgi:hypothetical protein